MVAINPTTIDYVSTVTAAIDRLVTSGSPVFLTEGNHLLTWIAVIMLVIFGLKAAAAVISHQHARFDLPGAISFFTLFLIAEAMLRYYYAPLPWVTSSFSSLLPDTARQYAAAIDITGLNTLTDRIHAILTGIEQPAFLNPLMVPVYLIILGFMAFISGLLFAVSVVGFIAIGVGALLGPLFIPWLMVPRLSWLFWNWLSFMLQYSFYRVVASAITFVWANVLVTFLDQSIHGDYSLGHFLIMLAPLALLSIGMLFSIFKITSFVSDLFHGAASAGAGLGLTLAAGIGKAFA